MSVTFNSLRENKFELLTASFWLAASISMLLDSVIYGIKIYRVSCNIICENKYIGNVVVSILGFLLIAGLVIVFIKPLNKNLFVLLAILTSLISFILFSMWIAFGIYYWTSIVAFVMGLFIILTIILEYNLKK